MITFLPSPLGEATSSSVLRAIRLLALLFPKQLLAIYLTGSWADGTAVSLQHDALNSSDIDLTIVFHQHLTSEEMDRFRTWRVLCEELGPFHLDQLDATAVAAPDIAEHGHLTLQTASTLLWGEDIRSRVPLPPLAAHIQRAVQLSNTLMATFRGISASDLALPLDYPDPHGLYYGYDFHDPDYGDKPGTRILVDSITWAATALVAIQAGQYAGSKQTAVQQYGTYGDPRWALFIQHVYEQCKLRWRYEIPQEAEAQHHLRLLCHDVLALESYCLHCYAEYLGSI